MSITPEIDNWLLKDGGYEYHCFISYAHTKYKLMTECVTRLKESIEEKLALSIDNPKVFIDFSDITASAIWREKIKFAICKSISMISVIAPIYYHPSHEWCGIEWAAMDQLSQSRLPNADFKTIIPVLIKNDVPLPRCISEVQYFDISQIFIRSRNYFKYQDFWRRIDQIVFRIEQIANSIAQNNSKACCDNYSLPSISAFSDFKIKDQIFPFKENN